jgi:hypothetical protein
MADNTELNPGAGGDIAAADDIGGVKYQRVKLTLGADGVNDGDVASGNPIPVADQDVIEKLCDILARLGILETARNVDGSLRVTSLGGSVNISAGTVTTVTTVGTVSNFTQEGGYQASANVQGFMNNTAAISNINNCIG